MARREAAWWCGVWMQMYPTRTSCQSKKANDDTGKVEGTFFARMRKTQAEGMMLDTEDG